MSRLKILEHFAQKASIEYPSSFEGPKLDNLQHDMIDTGPSKPYLRADGSGSFSFSSSTNIDLGDIRSQSASSKSGSQGTDKKPFTWRGRKKAKQAIGYSSPLTTPHNQITVSWREHSRRCLYLCGISALYS